MAFLTLLRAGFARYATYRQATVAAAFTNTAFGFFKCYVLLAVLGARTSVSGYDAEQLATFIWLGQGVLGIVMLWGWQELAERVGSGAVSTDLLRPINPLWTYLAADLGRALHAALTRLVVPLVAGALVFDLYAPRHLATYGLTALSVALAVVVSFSVRYLSNLAAFWVVDARGFTTTWAIFGSVATGLAVPLRFYPDAVQTALWATPFPYMFQVPVDIAVERVDGSTAALLVIAQLGWIVVLLGVCLAVQARGVRRLVVQGG